MLLEEGSEYKQITIVNTEVSLKLLDLSIFSIFPDHPPKCTFSHVLYDYNI